MIDRKFSRDRDLIEDLKRRFTSWGAIHELRPVGGGFSGSQVYRVTCDAGVFAVKLSPSAPQRFVLAQAHIQAIDAIASVDADLFPRIVRDADGCGVWKIPYGGEVWQGEASEWLSDSPLLADSVRQSDAVAIAYKASESVSSAFRLLAQFHLAGKTARISPQAEAELRWPNVLPQRYLDEWQAALPERLGPVRRALPRLESELRERASLYLDRLPSRARSTLAAFDSLPVELPELRLCLRDVHRKNIHFRSGEAAAFFDWDALRFDRRVGDYARLAASFGLSAGGAERRIDAAQAEIGDAESLSRWERAALEPAIATQVWIPPLRWLTWLLIERREFADPLATRARLRETLESALTEPSGADET